MRYLIGRIRLFAAIVGRRWDDGRIGPLTAWEVACTVHPSPAEHARRLEAIREDLDHGPPLIDLMREALARGCEITVVVPEPARAAEGRK